MEMNEAELVTRILAGEESLFAQLVTRYSGCVWAVCSSYVRNPSECEDVTQEVFVQCYRRLDTLRNPRALGAWLCQLARRHALMWLRTTARREQRLTRYGETETRPMTDNTGTEREELHEVLRTAIDGLPETYREALLLRYAEGYSAEQAAAFLGITAAAMRKRLERAQNQLRDLMWDQVEPALAKRKHSDTLANSVLAAIPFGSAPWLGAAGAGGAAAVSPALKGGISTMFGKLALAVSAVALVVGGAFTAVKATESTPAPAHPVKVAAAQPASPPPVSLPAPASTITPTTEAVSPPAPAAAPESAAPAAPSESSSAATKRVTTAPALMTGRIADKSGKPLPGAEVFLEVGRGRDRNDVVGHYRTKTDADGKYQIGGINDFGPAVLYARAEGFSMAFNACTVAEGKNLKGTDVVLEPAQWFVAGRVTDDKGAPVPDASVDCLYYAYGKLGLAKTAMTGVTTGNIGGIKLVFSAATADGRFRMAIPSPGLCDFRVVKDGFGTGFFAQIPTGREDAEFVLKPGGAISGKVTDANGQPVPNATVRITGEVRPGGLSIALAKIQPLLAPPVTVTTDDQGFYQAEGLGEDFTYAASLPDPTTAEVEQLPSKQGLRDIARIMRDGDQMMFGETCLARKGDLRVKPSQTTAGVDISLRETTFATLRGRVTDRATGKPVCPVAITAAIYESGNTNYYRAKFGTSTVTRPDGSYVLRVSNVTKRMCFSIRHLYMTEGGSAWEQPQEELAAVDLSPGDARELNFAVDAPITVPVRFLGTGGRPRQGIEAGISSPGSRYGCGGVLVSGPDGRVTFHGIRPGVSLEAHGSLTIGAQFIGVSEPFTGAPGQTIQEVGVVCRLFGGIAGVLSFPDRRPVANVDLLCGAQSADGSEIGADGAATTDESGRFQLPACLPEGSYAGVVVGFMDREAATPYSVTAPQVEIAAEAVTDLGALVVAPEKDLARVVAASGYDHTCNTAIARIYTPESLDALPDSLCLKTGFALYDMEHYEEALAVFQRMEDKANGDAMEKSVALVWQGHMLDLLGRRQEALAAYQTAADMNVTDTMRHDQFGLAYQPVNEAKERMNTPFVRVENKER
jgi:RNA polymerase sigma factor (sigma-70 family)